MHDVIDIRNLAYRTGSPIADVQEAGRKLFEQISGKDSDLTKALIEASDSSGLEPQQVLLILKVIAEDFRQPIASEASPLVPPVIQELAERTIDQVRTTAHAAKEKVSSVDLSTLKDKGAAIASSVRADIASVDLSDMKGRIVKAGEKLVQKAKSLTPDDQPAPTKQVISQRVSDD
ncbi:hypothetical protein IM511_07965 [Erythrobacteraceae bacterium E2-1 Yellow Sea]|nr:hypothetical protein [Erythrobacteraceae bacterium E2-1 Yellow Sea]